MIVWSASIQYKKPSLDRDGKHFTHCCNIEDAEKLATLLNEGERIKNIYHKDPFAILENEFRGRQ